MDAFVAAHCRRAENLKEKGGNLKEKGGSWLQPMQIRGNIWIFTVQLLQNSQQFQLLERKRHQLHQSSEQGLV